jgi:uncharacterized membrane protein YkoI
MRNVVAAVLLLALAAGCGANSAPPAKVAVPLSEIAPELMAVARQTLPNVTFDSARKIQVNGEDVFEIRGKQPNGKVREVEVSVSGKVVEVE